MVNNVTINLKKGEVVGLLGPNGAGKTTCFYIIAGLIQSDSGHISIDKSYIDHLPMYMRARKGIGYLPQEINVNSKEEILNEVLMANKQLLAINHRLDEINLEITTRTDYESESYLKLLTELSDLNEQLSLLDGDNQLKDAELILKGLGFEQNELSQAYSSFSGGWKMRVELAKLLIQKPNVILLDEPTNHLDIESIQWLEIYLKLVIR